MSALHAATIHAPTGGPQAEPDILALLASLSRDQQTLRCDYTDHYGNHTHRQVQPHRLVHYGRRWFLLAYDPDRDDWRTLRVDRLRPHTPPGARFTPREPSHPEAIERVTHGVATAFGATRTHAIIDAPAHAVIAQLPPIAVVEPLGPGRCTLLLGAATVHLLAIYLLGLDTDFDVTEPPELIDALNAIAHRAQR
jgi:predicted DNA-binding transcriptional regulator YafY